MDISFHNVVEIAMTDRQESSSGDFYSRDLIVRQADGRETVISFYSREDDEDNALRVKL
jgi:hypothetical protein